MNATPTPFSSALGAPANADEFRPNASIWPRTLDRRRFLEIMGAGIGLASSTGCFRPPTETIRPYVRRPEMLAADGEVLTFATTYNWRGFGRGIVATSRQGRPIKIEGNPDHPSTMGASDAAMQASVLDLYDPGRAQAPRRQGALASWRDLHAELIPRLAKHRADGGEGLWVAASPVASPTREAQWRAFREDYPMARVVCAAPWSHLHYLGAETDFSTIGTVVGVGADFLTDHPESLRFARTFATRRRGWDHTRSLNRFYQIQAAPSVTGTLADEILRAAPQRWPRLLSHLVRLLNPAPANPEANGLTEGEKGWLEMLASDLRRLRAPVLFVAGSTASTDVRGLVAALQQGFSDPSDRAPNGVVDPAAYLRATDNLESFAEALGQGAVETALILDTNPAYFAPSVDWRRALRKARWSAHFSTVADETSALCTWHGPLHHYLEDWNDLTSGSGLTSLAQPLIRPRFATVSYLEILATIKLGGPSGSAYSLVQDRWARSHQGDNFAADWREALARGIPGDRFSFQPIWRASPLPSEPSLDFAADHEDSALSLELRFDAAVGDGSAARNAWLQELPRPMSQEVWGMALWIAPATAAARKLRRGDVVVVSDGKAEVEIPVLPLEGVSENAAVAFLGGGRPSARLFDGQIVGSNLFPFFDAREPAAIMVRLRAAGRHQPVITTQEHHTLEGAEFVRVRRAGDEQRHADGDPHRSFIQTSFGPGPQWGMSIDLSSCTGCSACVTACQAENNIPVVGPEAVASGREMHWLRIDHYLHDDGGEVRHLVQPVPCMHCEKAPCEVVCPVAATVHDSHGMNAMVYNRCVGTRYCSNNCPYKVRRFNFLDWRRPEDDPRTLQHNPEVTVRERGVMEKCTYCVQRTAQALHVASIGGPETPLPAVQTACQQACPTEAIVFGDLRDATAEVNRRKSMESDYALLAELDTRPRTTYLPKWLNPNR